MTTTRKQIIVYGWKNPDDKYVLQDRDFHYPEKELVFDFTDIPGLMEWFDYCVKSLCHNAQIIVDGSLATYHYEYGDLVFELR